MIIISKNQIDGLEVTHPSLYSAATLLRSRLSNSGHSVFEDEAWQRLLDHEGARDYFKGEAEPMSAAESAKHFAQAMAGLVTGGKKIVPEEIYVDRLTICLGCQHWNPRAWMGLGGCRICRCTKFALRLAKSKCPLQLPKWLEWNGP